MSDENISLQKITDAIKNIEKDNGLLDDETFGEEVRTIWEASRFTISVCLQKKILGLGDNHQKNGPFKEKSSIMNKLNIYIIIYNIFYKNWLMAPQNREWMILQSSRKYLGQGRTFEDIYTDEIVDELELDKCIIIDRGNNHKYNSPRPHPVYYNEFTDTIAFLFKILFKKKIKNNKKLKSLINLINDDIKNKFYQSIDCSSIIYKKAASLKAYSVAYKLLLKRLKPKKILLVCSYGLEPLIITARELGIKTVEIQHGAISDDHLGYSLPPNRVKKSMPDIIWLFGEYWKNSVSWTIDDSRLKIFGYPFFDREFQKYSNIDKKDQVLFLSQGNIGSKLSKFAVKLSGVISKNTKIIYKLHPGEYTRWKNEYPWLLEQSRKNNFDVVDNNETQLYQLMAESKWQIGLNSTALFEGLAFECKTYLLNLPGIEYMQPLIKQGVVTVVNKPNDVVLTYEKPVFNKNYFFADDWQVTLKEIEEKN